MYTKNLSKVNSQDVKGVGGKGASLGEIIQAKIPVPHGFVVVSSAFDKFLEETDINVEIETKLHEVNLKDINSVSKISSEIRDLIFDAEFPKDIAEEIQKQFIKLNTKYVAVRSSATAEDSLVASWAGELESYINTTKTDLLNNVKKCWASLFTPRAIFYRFEKKLNGLKVSVAVVVQKMIQAEISGVCFTVHPITKDYDQMIIEAGYGLGEAIVGGKITPDSYVVHKKNKSILDKNINRQEKMIVRNKIGNVEKQVSKSKQNKQKINDKQILKLAEICGRIEKHHKNPQDIEWAFANNRFYILQSRPITTL